MGGFFSPELEVSSGLRERSLDTGAYYEPHGGGETGDTKECVEEGEQ